MPGQRRHRQGSRMLLALEKLFGLHRLWRVFWLFTVIFVFYLATTPNPYPIPASSIDKVNHAAAFIALSVLFCLGFPKRSPWLMIGTMLAYGIFIELVQALLPYRDCSFWDVVADSVGILIGLGICFAIPFLRVPIGFGGKRQTADHAG